MADFSALKQTIQNYIKQNGNKEITGAILQNILLSMVTTMGDGAINDNASDISDIKGDIQNINGSITDVSAKNPTAGPNNDGKWESLSALLSDASLNTIIPTSVRKGGMSIKFVQSSDNKYVQYRLILPEFTTAQFTNVSNWQGVDDEPTGNSVNLAESGGVAKYLPKITIQGKGTTLNSAPINYLQPGRKYKITFWHKWTVPETSGYAFALCKNSVSSANAFFYYNISWFEDFGLEHVIEIPNDAEIVIAVGRAVNGDNIIFNIEPYTEIEKLDIKTDRIGHSAQQSVILGKNKNVYGYSIGLVKYHKYRIDVLSDDTITGNQLSLNIYDNDTNYNIIEVKTNLLSGSGDSKTWDGSVQSFTFIVNQNYDNATIRSWCGSSLSDGVLKYNLYDITYDEINSKLEFIDSIDGKIEKADTIYNGTPNNPANANCVRTSPIAVSEGDTIHIITNRPLSAEGNYYAVVKYYKDSNGNVIESQVMPKADYLTQKVPTNAATTEIGFAEFNSSNEWVTLRIADFNGYYIGYEVKSLPEIVQENTENIDDLNSNLTLTKELNESSFFEVSSQYKITATNTSVYDTAHLRMVKFHTYEIKVSSQSSFNGNQISLKAVDYLTNTGFQIVSNLLTDGSWDGSEKTFKFTSSEDIRDAKIGSWVGSTVVGGIGGIINFTLKDISIEDLANKSTDINSLNQEVEYLPKIKTLKRATKVNNVDVTPISLLWFSDQHDNYTQNIARINAWRNKYASYIDDVLNCGDSVATKWNDDFSAFLNNGGDKMLMTIGNHDVADPNVSDNYYNGEVSNTDIYNKFMGIMDDSSLNVVRPTNAATLGLCYYYKDYGDRLRLIVVDTCIQDNAWIANTEHDRSYYEAQCTWLTNVLADAKTAGKAVVIASHFTASINENQDAGGFAYYTTPSSPIQRQIHEEFHNIVDTFINGGGEFITWLCGHTHSDRLGTVVNHPNQQMISITTSSYTVYRNVFLNNVVRSDGNKSEDAFNMISFDTVNKLIKIVRIGLNYDGFYRKIDGLTLNYSTHTVIK